MRVSDLPTWPASWSGARFAITSASIPSKSVKALRHCSRPSRACFLATCQEGTKRDLTNMTTSRVRRSSNEGNEAKSSEDGETHIDGLFEEERS